MCENKCWFLNKNLNFFDKYNIIENKNEKISNLTKSYPKFTIIAPGERGLKGAFPGG